MRFPAGPTTGDFTPPTYTGRSPPDRPKRRPRRSRRGFERANLYHLRRWSTPVDHPTPEVVNADMADDRGSGRCSFRHRRCRPAVHGAELHSQRRGRHHPGQQPRVLPRLHVRRWGKPHATYQPLSHCQLHQAIDQDRHLQVEGSRPSGHVDHCPEQAQPHSSRWDRSHIRSDADEHQYRRLLLSVGHRRGPLEPRWRVGPHGGRRADLFP